MRKSKAVTLALIGTALLASGGCGGSRTRTFYDKNGNVVPRSQWKKADGTPNELYDEQGNLVPTDQVNAAYSSSSSSSSRSGYRSGGFFFGPGWGSSYSSGGSRSSPGVSGSPSRGGFGSTGGSVGGGSSS